MLGSIFGIHVKLFGGNKCLRVHFCKTKYNSTTNCNKENILPYSDYTEWNATDFIPIWADIFHAMSLIHL